MNSFLSRKIHRLALLLLSIGITCIALFGLVGSTIDERGILREPFGLLPMGWLLVGFASILGMTGVLFRWENGGLPPRGKSFDAKRNAR